jgi:glycosyltransferase involved in cell wall biosynthesis
MRISVLIPVYNEVKTVSEILKRVEIAGIVDETIVINDGSTDGTTDILKTLSGGKYKIVHKENNMGKGSAIREGLKFVTGDIVIIQDADLEYNPKDYPALVEPIISGKADIVYGSRQGLNKIPLNIFRLGRWFVTILTNLLYGTKITDEPCGYKLFKTEVIKNIHLECERFEFCPEITAKVSRLGYKIYEVPISYIPRSVKEGKKITCRDGLWAIITLIKYRFINKV